MKLIVQLLFLLLLLVFIQCSVFAQTENLFVICERGGYGYINNKGEIVIEPQFDYADDFSEGRAVVMLEKKKKGHSKYGVINEKGQLVFRIELGEPDTQYNEGVLKVRGEYYENSVYYDINGKIIYYNEIFPGAEFTDGYDSVWVGRKNKIGFLNRNGKITVDTIFSNICKVGSGYAIVTKDGIDYLLDSSGKLIETSCFKGNDEYSQKSKRFSDHGIIQYGLIAVKLDGVWGYMNTKGNLVIKPQFVRAHNFSDGLALVSLKGRYGYIDTTGKYIIKPKYPEATDFSEGLAFVSTDTSGLLYVGSTDAVINKNGKIVFTADSVYGFEKYVNENNEVVIREHIFLLPSEFKDGMASFREGFYDSRIRYVNKEGKLIW